VCVCVCVCLCVCVCVCVCVGVCGGGLVRTDNFTGGLCCFGLSAGLVVVVLQRNDPGQGGYGCRRIHVCCYGNFCQQPWSRANLLNRMNSSDNNNDPNSVRYS
jgi:hypothetical protein